MQDIIGQMAQWDSRTVCIYVGAVFAAFLFANIYNRKKNMAGRMKYIAILLSFLSLWSVIAFSTCGADYVSYERIFNSSTSASYWAEARVEKGYILFNAIFKAIGLNYTAFHMIWAFVFLALIYKTIIYFEEDIDVGIAVVTFGAVYCFQSMNLMRLYLAMAFTVMSYKYYLLGEKHKYLISLIIAFFIHRSSVCLFMPFVFSIFFRAKKDVWIKISAAIFVLGTIYTFRELIFSTLSLFDNSYSLVESPSFGIANIIYHIPIAILLCYSYKKKKYNKNIFQKIFVMFLCSFIIGTTSYFVTMLGRMFVYFAPLYMFFPAYVVNRRSHSNVHKFAIKPDMLSLLKLMYIIFVIFRGFMMTELFYSDQIMPYTSIFTA